MHQSRIWIRRQKDGHTSPSFWTAHWVEWESTPRASYGATVCGAGIPRTGAYNDAQCANGASLQGAKAICKRCEKWAAKRAAS